jgi:glyoxylase-like metal-dependent hydrolase (beta-lactamase superfamily II)
MVYPIVVGSFQTNCYLYPIPHSSSECYVVDPGDNASAIIARIDAAGLLIRGIILTHGHFDHLLAVPDFRAWYGPSLEIMIHADDADFLGAEAYILHRTTCEKASGSSALIDRKLKKLPQPTRLLYEGDCLGTLQVLHLPGHTPGSAGFYDKDAGILFSGDTLFVDGVGCTDLPGGDMAQLESSLRRLFALPATVCIYPGHGSPFIIGSRI